MKKVLIVDDDVQLVDMYSQKFLKEGFEVKKAFDGVEGLEAISKELPDLILLDINMPRMDGFEVMKKLRADGRLKNIPVIIISNTDAGDVRIKNIVQTEPAYYLLKKDYTLAD